MDPSAVMLPLKSILEVIFYVLVAVYAIYSAVLYYHWQSFSIDLKVSGFTMVLYFAGSIPLVLTMGVVLLMM